jgi:hypothetical protein
MLSAAAAHVAAYCWKETKGEHQFCQRIAQASCYSQASSWSEIQLHFHTIQQKCSAEPAFLGSVLFSVQNWKSDTSQLSCNPATDCPLTELAKNGSTPDQI